MLFYFLLCFIQYAAVELSVVLEFSGLKFWKLNYFSFTIAIR